MTLVLKNVLDWKKRKTTDKEYFTFHVIKVFEGSLNVQWLNSEAERISKINQWIKLLKWRFTAKNSGLYILKTILGILLFYLRPEIEIIHIVLVEKELEQQDNVFVLSS